MTETTETTKCLKDAISCEYYGCDCCDEMEMGGNMKEPKTLEDAMEIGIDAAWEIMVRKRRMRGSENVTQQGLHGVVTRVVKDKMARIARTVGDIDLRRRMGERGIPPDVILKYVPLPPGLKGAVDALEDDFLDGMNYFLICWLLWKGWWELPLASELPEPQSAARAGGGIP